MCIVKKIKYPRLLLFFLSILVAFTIFYQGMNYDFINDFFISLGYLGTFFGGLFYSYGFTSTSATAVLLLISKGQTFWFAIIVAGVGALISDIVIYLFSRNLLLQELTMLKEESYTVKFRNFLKKTFGWRYRYIMPVVAGILIMSPLPTELGITILSSRKNLSMKQFMIITYLLHTVGISIILLISKQI